MLVLLLIWVLVGVALGWLVTQKRRDSAGLPLAYFMGLSLIHVPGALLYAEGDEVSIAASATTTGFEQTAIGMAAFLIGVLIARYAFPLRTTQQITDACVRNAQPRKVMELSRLALVYVFCGGVAYFLIMPLVGGIGTVTAIVASLGSLILVGACLWVWVANESGKSPWIVFALIPLMPLATVLHGGFIGFGVFWAFAILSFLFTQSRRRASYVLATPIFLFAGLSLFVNYMAARNDIRELVWIQQAGLSDKLEKVVGVFRDFEWLDLSNSRHREAIDGRLNQNLLVGAAVDRLESGQVEYALGSSMGTMIFALIPRAIWPDKPAIGGGGTIVRDFTGMEFAPGTSVGAGQVLEFYVNFGTWGVVGGFLLYGWLIGRMDLLVIRYLRQGDQKRFVLWFMVCLALLDAGGNLIAIQTTAASSAIAAYCISYVLQRRRKVASLPRASIM